VHKWVAIGRGRVVGFGGHGNHQEWQLGRIGASESSKRLIRSVVAGRVVADVTIKELEMSR
jgi:hypothetical protein